MNPYIQYDDGTLVQLLSKGDEAAFTVIYQRYWKRLYALAYNRLKLKEMAENIKSRKYLPGLATEVSNCDPVTICLSPFLHPLCHS